MKIAVIGRRGSWAAARRNAAILRIEVLPYDLPPSLVVGGMPTACVDLRTVPTLAFPSGTDAVVYLAQSPQYKNQSNGASELLAVNMLGAVKACEAAVGAGAKLFLYASSGSVAWRSFQPLDESCPTRRDDFYALSKLGAEAR
jgi:nucleoside-diphosphate-sugar epimerase